MLSKKIIELNSKVYDEYYDESIYDGWDIEDKIFNYKYLFKIQEFTGKTLKKSSILDVGCGTGSLLEHFTEASENLNLKQNDLGNYLGIDIYKPALKIARRNFPNYKFKNVDLLKNVNLEVSHFDYCFASGTFSLKFKKKNFESLELDNYGFLKKMVEKMYSFAIWGISFNFLTDKNKTRNSDSNLFYYNVLEVKKICKEFCENVHSRNNPLKSHKEPGKPQEYEDQETVYLVKKVRKNP